MHGRTQEAEQSIAFMEHEVEEKTGRALPPVDESKTIDIKKGEDHGYLALLRVLFREYPTRSILGATMMITQSFLYNAIFFTATLVLGKFYGVASENTPLYLIAFAVGNLVGPLALGHFFDTVGRRKMIFVTYVTSGVLLAISAFLFYAGALNAITQTVAWCVIFFFASAGASSAYLTSARSSRWRSGPRRSPCSSRSRSASARSARSSTARSSATATTRSACSSATCSARS